MEVKFGLYVLQTLVLFLFITQCFGNIFVVIDNFTPDAETKVRASNPTNTSTTVATGFFDGNDTLGIERDVSVTVYPGTSARLVSTTFVSGSWSASYVEKVTGRILVQYDGQDGGDIKLNLNPGLRGEDLTQSGSAYAMYLQVSSDHPVNYSIAVYGNTPAVVSVYNLTHNAATDKLTDYVIPFTDFVGSATFTSVFGMELALDNNLGGNATDSFVALFGVFGFLVSGTVYYDCNNNGILDVGEVGLPGATVTVTNSVGAVVRTQTTSTDGTYAFTGLLPGTYSICVVSNDPQATPSNPSSGCYRNFVLSGIKDFSGSFGYFVPTVITPPPPKTVECGACLLPFDNCTGAPTIVGCAGVPKITVSDQNTTTCPQIITRTFSAVGATSVQQIITVNDTIKPLITNNQDVTVPCFSKTPSISSWVASHAFASVSDCTAIRWTSNYNNSAAPDCGTFPVTFTATDLCNNAVSFTNNYITTDTVSPQITRAAANQVVNCNINSQSVQNTYTSFVNSHANATAVDDCTSNFALNWTSNAPATITQDCLFNQQVTFRVADVCGNVNTTTSVFTVQDVSPPTITSQARSLTVPCNSNVDQAYKDWLDNHANATATDLCSTADDLEWSNNGGSTPTGCNAANVVTFQVKDSCNRVATTQASFTITSSTGPILDNPAQPLNIDCAANSSSSAVAIKAWLDDNGGARATDNCTGVEWSNNFGSVSGVNCLGIPVTFTACNLCTPKQCVSTTANVTITDSQPPSFRVPPQPEVVDCDDYTAVDFTTWLATGGNAVVRDNCVPDGTTIPITNNWPANTPLPNGCNNTATVTFYATDLCGNTSPGSVATFTVHDVTAPSITKATNISVECNDSNQNSYNNWLANHGLATASDPCSNITWSFIGNSTIPKNCSVTQTVTFIASDDCGLKNQTVGSYTLTDRTPPRLTHAAVDLNVTCTTDTFNATLTQWLKSNGGATAVDDCTSVSWSNNFKGLTAGCTQSSLVSFVASDQCGFNVTTAATFSLIDTQQPVIVDFAQSESVPCNSNTSAALKDFLTRHGGATAVDACQPSNNLVWGNNFGTAPTQCRSIEVTFSVTDGCGRFAYTTADFSITDSSAPEITSPAENITVECDGMGNTVQYAFWVSTNAGANAFDFCAINVTWSNDASLTGPVGCGSEKVVFRVTDGCNNFNSTAATFTVADTKPPVISPTAVSTVVECDGNGNQDDLDTFLSSNGGALAHDVCSGSNVVWTYSILNTSSDSFSCTNYTTYIFTVTDQCGKSANTTASFGITDDGKPQIDNPAQQLTIQCGESNNQTITDWLNSNAEFQVTDACSSVTYSNNFYQNQTNPGFGCFVLPVTFYATDFCGHVVSSVADLTLVDNTPPSFVDFPPDLTLPCDVTTFPEDTGFPKVQDACFSNLDDFVTYHDTTTQGPPDPSTPYCPANKVIVRTFTVKDPCNNSYSQNQTLTIEIARSSGACDSSSCVCDNECCPQPAASDCLAVDCLPQNCAAVLCESVPCSCGFEKRDLPVSFENSPIPQCEPIFIHVADDDDDSVSLTVNAKATLNNYVISDKPIPQEELEKMKSKKVKANKV